MDLYTEHWALARVHWRVKILETDMGRGGGTIVVSRLRPSSP